ncbi:MAG: right-handed parallel beta-helix repeat-containing protein, partial [Thermoplasmata archaeon]|nr:right-handed parallel beta-helix repeat-containing protein [Thermoplasmata archaeon]
MGRINMRLRILKITMIAVIFVLAAFTPLLLMQDAEGMETRAPNLVGGHISSDDEWDYHLLTNVVIDPDVTITVPAGGQIWLPEDSFFYVEGTLIVNGVVRNEVEFALSGISGTYDGIVVNTTGNVIIRNATIVDAHQGVVLGGMPSLIENTEIHSGDEGIAVTSSGNRIESCFIHHQNIAGIQFRTSTGPNYINKTEIDRIDGVGLGLDTTTGVYTQNLDVGDTDPGVAVDDCSDINFIKSNIALSVETMFTTGIYLRGDTYDVYFNGLTINNFHLGVYFGTNHGSNVLFDNALIGPDVIAGVYMETDNVMDAVFLDSSIDVSSEAVALDGQDGQTHINLINTSIDGGSVVIAEGGWVNMSWLLDLNVIDGNGDPVDFNLKVKNGSEILLENDYPLGTALDIPILSVMWGKGVDNGTKVMIDLEITSNDDSGTYRCTCTRWFFMNEKWIMTMDLWPTNDLSAVLEV